MLPSYHFFPKPFFKWVILYEISSLVYFSLNQESFIALWVQINQVSMSTRDDRGICWLDWCLIVGTKLGLMDTFENKYPVHLCFIRSHRGWMTMDKANLMKSVSTTTHPGSHRHIVPTENHQKQCLYKNGFFVKGRARYWRCSAPVPDRRSRTKEVW
jgi:hypothetical protein